MSSAPFLFLSPALPTELLTYILNHHAYPTTLIVCSPRPDFLASLADEVRREAAPELSSPVKHAAEIPPYTAAGTADTQGAARRGEQVAASRHIHVVYIPTVTHLRAYLSVFSPDDSKVPPPPANFKPPGKCAPRIVLYGFLGIHRDTSEWSAQGLSNSASAVVELGHRLSWQAVIVEPRKHGSTSSFEDMLKETVPFLSGGGRRAGPDSDEGGWTGRTVEVGRIMKRWFRFQCGPWDVSLNEDGDENPNDGAC
ncbi:hypothetical protein AAE478_000531 [Parahypoxylon ruwenzoriense]